MAISWTKTWAGGDDGTLLKGVDLANLQSDIAANIGDATSIQGFTIDVPDSGDDGLALTFDNGNSKFTYTDLVPSGVIVLWSGAVSAIPSGWVICDGTNSTPDLTGLFVIHADADSGGTYNVGDTGGSTTIAEANLPAHDHAAGTLSADSDGAHGHTFRWNTASSGGTSYLGSEDGAQSAFDASASASVVSGGAHTHSISGSTAEAGSGTAYLQPYYALAYIMKT